MPVKAAYLKLETNPELEFEHFLAQKLGMTVDQLRAQLTNEEFVRWHVYYGRKAQREQLERLKADRSRSK